MFKKIIITLLVIIIAAVGGLSYYVSTIDWNLHKAKIAEKIENVTGKKVVFEGKIDLAFWPHPYLTAENIKIYNQAGEGKDIPLAVIRKMVTDLKVSPLLKGQFEIDNMTLQEPRILVEFMPDGKLNWYSAVSDFQRDTLGRVEIALNSVMLKNATVQIVNAGLDLDITLQNLNAEITAQSLYGPYRIDGNFVKDKKPAGFALNIGTLSESFGTSLNLVLTHPTTKSYARFDGQMLASYDELEGNFSVESKNPAKFANEFSNQVILPLEFDYPLTGSAQIKINPQQIDLTSVVLKYGDSAGAGNVLIPLKPATEGEKRKIEVSFEMTAFDMMPAIGMILQQIKNYTGNKKYDPSFDFDLIADLKALKATAKGSTIRNLAVSVDVLNNVITVKKIAGLFPGDTDIATSGDIFENEDRLSYDFEWQSTSQDFLKFLEWLDLKPKTYAPSTYRGAQLSAKISGTPDQIKISPLSFSLDNNTMSGVIGIVRGARTRLFAAVQSEKINFDNYLPPEDEKTAVLPLNERVKRALKGLSFIDDYDVQIQAKLTTGVYRKIPFEKTDLKLTAENGRVKLEKLHIEDLASASVDLNGMLSGLSSTPSVENMKYRVETADFNALKQQVPLPLPSWPLWSKAKTVRSEGIMTGNMDLMNVKAVTSVNDSFLKSVYTGKLFNQNGQFNFIGRLEFNTEFVKFIKSLGFNYRPKNMPSSVFTFKGVVAGNPEKWSVKDIDAFISSNHVQGNFSVEMKNNRPLMTADLQTTRLELDRLLYNAGKAEPKASSVPAAGAVSFPFLAMPSLSTTPINYDFYKTFDLNAHLTADLLNYDLAEWSNAVADLKIANGNISLKNFNALLKDGETQVSPVRAEFDLTTEPTPKIKGMFAIDDYYIEQAGGRIYALVGGRMNANFSFDTSAKSASDFLLKLSGLQTVDIKDFIVNGWNLDTIRTDVDERTISDGFSQLVRNNLEKGTTPFSSFYAELDMKDGEFVWKNATMSSPLYSLSVTGSGNLSTWTTDTSFVLSFNGMENSVSPLDFRFQGKISDPALTVNVKNITDKYDAYWAKVASDRKAVEDEQAKQLKASMDQAQERVETIYRRVMTEALPLLQKYKPLSSNADIKSVYDSTQIVLTDLKNRLELMKEKTNDTYTMEDVSEMQGKLENFDPQINEMIDRLNENYIRDLKVHAGNAYRAMQGISSNVASKERNYQKTLNAYASRLRQLNSLVVLDREPRATDYKQAVETSLTTLKNLYIEAEQLRTRVDSNRNLSEVEEISHRMVSLKNDSEKELERLNTSLETLFDYAKNLVYEEEKAQRERGMADDEDQEDYDDEYEDEDDEEEDEDESEDLSVPQDNVLTEDVNQRVEPMREKVESQEQEHSDEITIEDHAEVPVQPETAGEPLIKPLEQEENDIVSYTGKVASSGNVAKATNRVEEAIEKPVETLLRPIGQEKVSSGGTLTRKPSKLNLN